MVDKDKDYQRIKNEGITSTLNPLEMELILAGQPIGMIEDLTQEANVADRLRKIEVDTIPVKNVEDLIPDA